MAAAEWWSGARPPPSPGPAALHLQPPHSSTRLDLPPPPPDCPFPSHASSQRFDFYSIPVFPFRRPLQITPFPELTSAHLVSARRFSLFHFAEIRWTATGSRRQERRMSSGTRTPLLTEAVIRGRELDQQWASPGRILMVQLPRLLVTNKEPPLPPAAMQFMWRIRLHGSFESFITTREGAYPKTKMAMLSFLPMVVR
jgi:hypothetical protein